MSDEIKVTLKEWSDLNDMITGMDIENRELHLLLKQILGFPEDDRRKYVVDVYRDMYEINRMSGKFYIKEHDKAGIPTFKRDEISTPLPPMYDHDNPTALNEWEKLDMAAMDESMGIKKKENQNE